MDYFLLHEIMNTVNISHRNTNSQLNLELVTPKLDPVRDEPVFQDTGKRLSI